MKKSRQWAPRRAISTWELDDFFRGLRKQIVACEEAFERGKLAEVVEQTAAWPESHPSILAAYRRLVRARGLEPVPYRQRAVHTLLAGTKRELFELPQRFEARAIHLPKRAQKAAPSNRGALEPGEPGSSASLPGLVVKSRRGEVYLRIDQVLSVRRWGIGFLIDDPEMSDGVTDAVAQHAADQLAFGLIGVEKIMVRLEARGLREGVELVPPEEGRGFEQLFCDILNEHYPCARQAPLYEDFFEKTDLRLHTRGLSRRRGARAQVTRSSEPVRHDAKLAGIKKLSEFVILSPLALARALTQEHTTLGLDQDQIRQFWQCFEDPADDAVGLGRQLKGLLLAALEQPFSGPRGPLAAVPEPVRLLVQSYAAVMSQRTTASMRDRLIREQEATL